MTAAVATLVAITLTVSAVCIAVRVRLASAHWRRDRALRRGADRFEARARTTPDLAQRAALRLLAAGLRREADRP